MSTFGKKDCKNQKHKIFLKVANISRHSTVREKKELFGNRDFSLGRCEGLATELVGPEGPHQFCRQTRASPSDCYREALVTEFVGPEGPHEFGHQSRARLYVVSWTQLS